MTARSFPVVAVVRSLAAAITLVAGVTLISSAADQDGGPAVMQPNTAVLLLLVAAALLLLTRARTTGRAVALLGGVVMLGAAATLFEYLSGADLGIDRVLAVGQERHGNQARTAGLAAVALLLLGFGLVTARSRPRVMQLAALAAFLIGYTALLGYAMDVRALHAFDGFRNTKLPTAAGVTAAAVALLCTRPDRGLVHLLVRCCGAGALTRRVVPFLLLGAPCLGVLELAGERAGLYRPGFGSALLTLSIATVGIAVVWRAAVVIGRAETARDASDAALHQVNAALAAQVETLVATSPDAIITVGPAGTIEAANHHAADLFARPVGELVGQPVELLLPERLRSRHVAHRTGYARMPRLRPMGEGMDLVGARPDGSEFPVSVSLAPMVTDDRQVVLATVRDMTEARAAEAALRESAHRFAAAFDEAPVGMLLADLDGHVRQVNRALARMLGYAQNRLPGQNLAWLIDPRDVDDDLRQQEELLAGQVSGYQRELRLIDGDGEPVWTLTSTALVRSAQGTPAHFVLHIEDIRGRKQYEGRLQYLADHDPLTGLFNRRRFDQELSRHLLERARYGGDGAVLLLDLDNFKYVNDTLGHGTGDALIRSVANALRERVRGADLLARLGGDEFAVLLPAARADEAQVLAEELLAAIRASGSAAAATRTRTTASIGIAALSEPGLTTAEQVLAAADLAMYAAKEDGRDRVARYDPAGPHLARSQARFRWLDRIHTALENDLLTLHAQPIVDLNTGQVTQVELLLRMREGDALVPPGLFIYIAERHGLSPPIDRWVIRHAIAYAASQTDPDAPRVEVNLSADSLADATLPGLIADLLAEHRVDPRRMVFEVTETAAIANIDTARSFVEQLAELGCGFALDDFGAGFGSFYYLKYLPFDYLKIDGEFIRQLARSRTDQLIVTSIVSAAHGLGKKTIAEYVTDEETLELLRGYGVDYAQGYHVGRPVDLAVSRSRWLTESPTGR